MQTQLELETKLMDRGKLKVLRAIVANAQVACNTICWVRVWCTERMRNFSDGLLTVVAVAA